MQNWIKRLCVQWTTSDTLVLAANVTAFVAFIGNTQWESVAVAYCASIIPLCVQTAWACRRPGPMRRALVFGGLVALAWPFGEWFVVHAFGWWGKYLAAGLAILETPLYCALVGWLASSYCCYVSIRIEELGGGKSVACVLTGISAFIIGAIGENLFVAAQLWIYDDSAWDLGRVPAFVPIAYGLAYAFLPFLRRLPIIPATFIFTIVMLFISIGLGLLTGFFPR